MALLKRKRSGLSDPMSVVTRFVNACNRHDADSVAACLHPEFDSIQPMYPSRNFRGADQVRRNWAAIFEAEPGFRLTVLRQAGSDDTVWLELHGAGRDAEVAGVFVMGVQGDRIRWARIYSALIEPLPEGMVDAVASSPANLRQVPPLADGSVPTAPPTPESDAVVEEDLIAPVVDIDGGARRRRRRSSRRRGEQEGTDGQPTATDGDDAAPVTTEAETTDAASIDPVNVAQPVDLVEPDMPAGPVEAATEEAPADAHPVAEPEPVAVEAPPAEAAHPDRVADVASAQSAESQAAEPEQLEERAPDVVAVPEPTQAWAQAPAPDVAPPAADEVDPDAIVWGELAEEEADPAPKSATEPRGRPEKRRGWKKR